MRVERPAGGRVPCRVVPVIDLLGGVVVHGVRGQRDRYLAIQSRLVDRPDPRAIAAALRRHYSLTELYLADLDAIQGGRPNVHTLRDLVTDGFRVMIDSGAYDARHVENLLDAGADRVVIGLETCPGAESLADLVAAIDPARMVFSLDLMAGRPIASHNGWRSATPLDIAAEALAVGLSSLLVLDLAGVGSGEGLSTLTLCQELRRYAPPRELLTGGGVRGLADIHSAADAGVDGLLVASALHNGQLAGWLPPGPLD
ncbi:MAG: HisA/HisF-related TIM barrel protein [Planctomycetaceae bacterium]